MSQNASRIPDDAIWVSGDYKLKNRFGNVIRRGTFTAPLRGHLVDAAHATFTPPLGEERETDRLEFVWSEP